VSYGLYEVATMNRKPHKSKISVSQSGNGQTWELPARKGVGFLMVFGCFFGGLPLMVLSFTAFAFFFGNGESGFDSIWGFLALFGFLSIFILIGSVVFYFGFKMRYTSFQVTLKSGAVEVLRTFLKKQTKEKLERGSVYGVGLYSNSETNNKPDYGLLVKAREGKDIKVPNGYKEDELRWLASEILAELDQQGGLPTEKELEEVYFSSANREGTTDKVSQFSKKGVVISLLDKSGGNHFVIEKNESTIGKVLIAVGLFEMIFGSLFLWVAMGDRLDNMTLAIIGSLVAIMSLVIFFVGLFKLGTTNKFSFKADTIVKEKIRRGVSKKKEVFHKSSFNTLKIASSGNSNNETRYSVKLMGTGAKKPLKLFSWVDQEISDVVKLKVNAWLKPPSEEPSKPTLNSGYGSAMATESSQRNIVGSHSIQNRTQPDDVPIYDANISFKDIKGGVWMLRIFLGLFLCLGLGLLIFGTLNFMKAKDSETWPSEPGTILSSKITSHDSDDGTTYGADVSYRFALAGKSYEGDSVTISEVSTSDRSQAVKIVQRYPAGKKVAVYYDPSSPDDNVLETGLSTGNWLLPGIGLLFFIVPLGLLIFTERSNRKQSKETEANRHSVKNIENRYGKVE